MYKHTVVAKAMAISVVLQNAATFIDSISTTPPQLYSSATNV